MADSRRVSAATCTPPAVPARRGRRRDPSRDAAIRAGVLEVLSEVGYRGLTMDAVALAAGVGKATIYRRWSSKADLLIDVIEQFSAERLVLPDTGSLRGDLVVLLQSLADVLAGPGGGANRALLGVLTDEPALAAAYRQGPLRRWAEAFAATFERAVRRGEVSAAAGTSLAAEAGPAILIERWLFGEQPINADVVAAVVDDLMLPMLMR